MCEARVTCEDGSRAVMSAAEGARRRRVSYRTHVEKGKRRPFREKRFVRDGTCRFSRDPFSGGTEAPKPRRFSGTRSRANPSRCEHSDVRARCSEVAIPPSRLRSPSSSNAEGLSSRFETPPSSAKRPSVSQKEQTRRSVSNTVRLMMVRLPLEYGPRPVNLLEQHQPRHLVEIGRAHV